MSQTSKSPNPDTSTVPDSKRAKLSTNSNDFDVFGFDMDMTLVEYHTAYLMKWVYTGLQNYLVEECGVSRDSFIPVSQIDHMFFRGAIIDVDNGNVLQVDKDGVVAHAFHGLKSLTREEIVGHYGEGRWKEWDSVLQEHLIGSYPDPNKIIDETTRTTYILDSEFDTSASGIFSCVVESIENSESESDTIKEQFNIAWKNIGKAFSSLYKINQENPQNSFYTHCKKTPGNFVKKIEQKSIECLRKLKAKGKCVFLLTTSNYDYTHEILKVAYGDSWRELFTVVLTNAKKPTYFTCKGQTLYRVSDDDECKLEACDSIEAGGMYTQGNVGHLNKFLASHTNKEQPTVLYVGDNMRADVQGASRVANWKCGCLIGNLTETLETSPKEKSEVGKFPGNFVPNSHITTRNGSNSFWFEKMLSLGYIIAPNMESLCEVLSGDVSVDESAKVRMGYNM